MSEQRRPTYKGTPSEVHAQMWAVVGEGFCPYCGARLRPATPADDVQVEAHCSAHGLFVIERDGETWHHVTPQGLADGCDWRSS